MDNITTVLLLNELVQGYLRTSDFQLLSDTLGSLSRVCKRWHSVIHSNRLRIPVEVDLNSLNRLLKFKYLVRRGVMIRGRISTSSELTGMVGGSAEADESDRSITSHIHQWNHDDRFEEFRDILLDCDFTHVENLVLNHLTNFEELAALWSHFKCLRSLSVAHSEKKSVPIEIDLVAFKESLVSEASTHQVILSSLCLKFKFPNHPSSPVLNHVDALSQITSIRELAIENMMIDSLDSLNQMLGSLFQVEKLTIKNLQFKQGEPEREGSTVLRSLSHNKTMKALTYETLNRIDVEDLVGFINLNQCVLEINIPSIQIDQTNAKRNLSIHNNNIQRVPDVLLQYWSTQSSLTRADLSYISEPVYDTLTSFHFRHLKSIHLWTSHGKADSNIASIIVFNSPVLKELVVNVVAQISSLAEILDALAENRHLETLSFLGTSPMNFPLNFTDLVNFLKTNKSNLKTLNLGQVVGWESEIFSAALASNQHLTSISIDHVDQFQSSNFQSLIKLISENPRLVSLDFPFKGNAKISSTQLTQLRKVLSDQPTLRSLRTLIASPPFDQLLNQYLIKKVQFNHTRTLYR